MIGWSRTNPMKARMTIRRKVAASRISVLSSSSPKKDTITDMIRRNDDFKQYFKSNFTYHCCKNISKVNDLGRDSTFGQALRKPE